MDRKIATRRRADESTAMHRGMANANGYRKQNNRYCATRSKVVLWKA